MGSEYKYQLPATDKLGPKDVEVALNPEELESLDQETLKRKYEATLQNSRSNVKREDLSDMVEEHARQQSQKRIKKDDPKKKHKDFKF
jgi:hypothetical protein